MEVWLFRGLGCQPDRRLADLSVAEGAEVDMKSLGGFLQHDKILEKGIIKI